MRRLKTGLSRAATSVPMLSVDEERWEDNRMIFRVRAMGQAANGNVDVVDIKECPEGLRVRVYMSKGNRESAAEEVGVPFGRSPIIHCRATHNRRPVSPIFFSVDTTTVRITFNSV